MKLEKAIKILQTYQVEGEAPCGGFLDDALKLGIEAMKRVERNRGFNPTEIHKLLPGETKE